MKIEITNILKADDGKILRNKNTNTTTPSLWLKIGDTVDNWEEIDIPVEED